MFSPLFPVSSTSLVRIIVISAFFTTISHCHRRGCHYPPCLITHAIPPPILRSPSHGLHRNFIGVPSQSPSPIIFNSLLVILSLKQHRLVEVVICPHLIHFSHILCLLWNVGQSSLALGRISDTEVELRLLLSLLRSLCCYLCTDLLQNQYI